MRRRQILPLLIIALCSLLLLYRLSEAPPLWFDEGWPVTVARNWLLFGEYKQLLMGQLVPADMLNIGWPAVAPVALSFKVFGIGIWQARLPNVIFMVVSLVLLYRVSAAFSGARIALGVLFIVPLLLSGAGEAAPLIAARQVVGEVPMVCFLLAGFLGLLLAETRPYLGICLTSLFWALSAITKIQVLPFLVFANVATVVFSFIHERKHARQFVAVALLWPAIYIYLLGLDRALLSNAPTHHLTTDILLQTSIVLQPTVRLGVLTTTLLFQMPLVAGLAYAVRPSILPRLMSGAKYADIVRLMFLLFVVAWFLWYVFLSVGWPRYAMCPVFLGSYFVAKLLAGASTEWRARMKLGRSGLLPSKLLRQAPWIPISFLVASAGLSGSVGYVYRMMREADDSVIAIATFLNKSTPEDVIVETFDSEIYAFLNRRYHYPPIEVALNANRRVFLLENVTVNYNALTADPDYLLIGPFGRMWELYDQVLEPGVFRAIMHTPRYTLYERIR